VKGSGKRRICVICESIFDIPQLKHGRDRKSKRITCGQSCHLKLIKKTGETMDQGRNGHHRRDQRFNAAQKALPDLLPHGC
jgi:hypothetical protein